MAAPPRNARNIRIRVSATLAGTYTVLSMARSYDHTAGTEGGTTLRWFGGTAIKPGDTVDDGTITVWWDPMDTTGQDLMRASRDNGTTVFIQLAREGTATGAKVRQMEIQVTEYGNTGDVTADGIEETYSYTAVPGTISTVTLA
jgi:hypothetical protein